MLAYRAILVCLIALAVAVAPVRAAFAANHPAAEQAMHDCHGNASQDCQSCDTNKASCSDEACGIRCCKLVGLVTVAPVTLASTIISPLPADPQKPPDWQLKPRPPPPRA